MKQIKKGLYEHEGKKYITAKKGEWLCVGGYLACLLSVGAVGGVAILNESDTKAAYEKFKTELGDKEYNARHILVASEAEAKDVIAQLNKGGDFSKIAKEKSIDPGSKEKGGDLGWFALGGMVKPFSEAVSKLQKGKLSTDPVQTQFGWHVIKLDDIRELKAPPYDKVKDNLQKQLGQRQLEKMLTDLRAKATIVDNTKSASKK